MPGASRAGHFSSWRLFIRVYPADSARAQENNPAARFLAILFALQHFHVIHARRLVLP
jgi:hypothetical protein